MLRAGPLDLFHQHSDRVIGCYLLETEDGPALFDCGPSVCVPELKARLAEHGLGLTDVRHLLLSHIHLDHAGAAGVLVREHPALQVHVSGIGAPHLVEPSRLERSARRLYGDTFDGLWGELAAVPKENVRVAGERVLDLECFPSPGHASHHVCYVDGEGTLYAGDAAGVRIHPARFVVPPTPPPEFDLESWQETIDELERRAPQRMALIHFGVFEDVTSHLLSLRRRLAAWVDVVAAGTSEREFVDAVRAELASGVPSEETVGAYDRAIPFWQSYQGVKRYCTKKAERAA